MPMDEGSQTQYIRLNNSEDSRFLGSRGTQCTNGESDAPFVDGEHAHGVLHALNQLRQRDDSSHLLDCVLVDSAGAKARAHRAVVAASCCEFEALIASSTYKAKAQKPAMLEMQLKTLHPALEHVTAADVEALFKFIYTGLDPACERERVPALLVLCAMVGTRNGMVERLRARVDPCMAASLFQLSVAPIKPTNGAAKWDPTSTSDAPKAIAPALEGALMLSTNLLTRHFAAATCTIPALKALDERAISWLIDQDSLCVRDEALGLPSQECVYVCACLRRFLVSCCIFLLRQTDDDVCTQCSKAC